MKQEKVTTPEPNSIITRKIKKTDKNTGKEMEVPVEVPEFGINGREKFALGNDLHKGTFIEPKHREVAVQLTDGAIKTPVKK